ncbi:hypothetical protein K503DRAFT_867251 [Rhizopogon vinicolor AM-OR11-026]|uniref:Mug135-like C-terminal domain-containing protein n=1 Tax=Rhizopogon vinicolor AM-OR11-026 TaxID=1314800 RepID=A0A1B7MWA6_9AGAM|nr:hypothetical protein K503DRAFT_867251 [Rhizopogon vinicolor AM-OR11-026]
MAAPVPPPTGNESARRAQYAETIPKSFHVFRPQYDEDKRQYRLFNQQALDGSLTRFQTMLFPDDTDPTQPPHNLPRITNVQVVNDMDWEEQDVLAYDQGYYRGTQGNFTLEECRKCILMFIGVPRVM